MNKAELIDVIAKTADISRTAAGRAYGALMTTTLALLKKEGTVRLTGLGTFTVTKSADGSGRRGAEKGAIGTPPKGVVKFKPGKELQTVL